MPEIYMVKMSGVLIPADEEAREAISKMKPRQMVRVKYTTPRNYGFHRKWFALLNIGFDNWNPPDNEKTGAVKSFDRFRRDITILAGHYNVVVRLNGTTRVEAKSVSFAKMTQEEFEALYSTTIDVLIKQVYHSKMKPEELNRIVEEYLSFA